MDDSNQERCEDGIENSSTRDEFRRNRCRLHGSFEATGVYIDLLRRAGLITRAEEEAAANGVESSSLAEDNTENSIRGSLSNSISNLEDGENNETRQMPETETGLATTSSILEPFTMITAEETASATEIHPHEVQTGPPPSYTSLPPPIPAIGLPPIVHPPPPPTYEQTFGLRYLDRDQPVLVFNSENMWGYRPQLAYCRSCNAMVLTHVNAQYCHATHFIAIISFLLCCWPCCVLPYFIPALKEAHHHCPACNNHLGTYHPFTRTA